MKKLVFFFAFCLALSSCKTVELLPLQSHTTTTKRDSTTTKIVPRDSLLVIPADSLQFSVLFSDLTSKGVSKRSKSGNLLQTLRREGNTVIADCKTEELQKIIQLQDKLIEKYQQINTLIKEKQTIEVTKMPSWAKPFLWLGIGFVITGLALVILKIISTRKLI